jgi:ArsR family transcriptional regulator
MTSLADTLRALADPTRLRLLRLLDEAELHVNELVDVLELPQPTVSRHLAVLHRAAIVNRRRDGQWTFYSWAASNGGAAAGLGPALRTRLRELPEASRDLERLQACIEARARSSREFYARVAPNWDRLRAGLDLEGLHGRLLGALLPGTLDLVDAGTGTGALLPVLAPAARQLIGVDRSAEMLAEAARRLTSARLSPVTLVRGDLESLPLGAQSADGVCSLFALHHAARPETVAAEFARVLRPGGSVVVGDLVSHTEEWMRTELAHAWLGFPPERVASWFARAGLVDVTVDTVHRRQRTGANAMPEVFVVRAHKPHDA